jgi:hypothetical protein
VEEFELWSTTVINAAIIFGAAAGAFRASLARVRRVPPQKILQYILGGAVIGALTAAAFAITSLIAQPPSEYYEQPFGVDHDHLLSGIRGRELSRGERFIQENLPRMTKEVQSKYAAEKKRGMPNILAWCRATSVNNDDIDDCIVLMSH